MKLVIEIDEKYYTDIKESEHCGNYSVLYALDAIRNGTPLPKGHGKLKDVDAFLQKVKKDRERVKNLETQNIKNSWANNPEQMGR